MGSEDIEMTRIGYRREVGVSVGGEMERDGCDGFRTAPVKGGRVDVTVDRA